LVVRFSNKLRNRKRGVVVRQGLIDIGPNEPCPCGRGLKYKRCCGAATGLLGWWRRRRAHQIKAKTAAR